MRKHQDLFIIKKMQTCWSTKPNR